MKDFSFLTLAKFLGCGVVLAMDFYLAVTPAPAANMLLSTDAFLTIGNALLVALGVHGAMTPTVPPGSTTTTVIPATVSTTAVPIPPASAAPAPLPPRPVAAVPPATKPPGTP